MLCLRDSAANDGLCGMAATCDMRCRNVSGEPVIPAGRTLHVTAAIGLAGLDERAKNVNGETIYDIAVPLCGPAGAAAVFGSQKGTDEAMVERLDWGLVPLTAGRSDMDRPTGGHGRGSSFPTPFTVGSRDSTEGDSARLNIDLRIFGEAHSARRSIRGEGISGVARGGAVAAPAGEAAEMFLEFHDLKGTAVFSIKYAGQSYKAVRSRTTGDLRDDVAYPRGVIRT